jgi:hypothetical protein
MDEVIAAARELARGGTLSQRILLAVAFALSPQHGHHNTVHKGQSGPHTRHLSAAHRQ